MIRIDVRGMEEVQRELLRLRDEKIPSATRNAINDTAFQLKAHLQGLITSTFKNPHPSTIKNIFVKAAGRMVTSKNSKGQQVGYDRRGIMSAVVTFDQLYRRGVDEYMLPLIEGGGRSKKPSEQRFGAFTHPADKVNKSIINKYGNITGGKMMQILSRLSLMESYAGAMQNISARSQARMKGSKRALEYFMIKGQKRGGLMPGIYERIQSGKGFGAKTKKSLPVGSFQQGRSSGGIASVIRGRGAKPVVLFTKAPSYRPQLPFFTSGTAFASKALMDNIKREVDRYINKGFSR